MVRTSLLVKNVHDGFAGWLVERRRFPRVLDWSRVDYSREAPCPTLGDPSS